MAIDTTEEYEQLVERTEATLEKFRERAEELKEELSSARAATKVQIKAMIQRLEKKYEDGTEELISLRRGGSDNAEQIVRLHQKIVASLSDMKRTIDRRILQ